MLLVIFSAVTVVCAFFVATAVHAIDEHKMRRAALRGLLALGCAGAAFVIFVTGANQ